MSGCELTNSELRSLGLAARNQAGISASQSVQLKNPDDAKLSRDAADYLYALAHKTLEIAARS